MTASAKPRPAAGTVISFADPVSAWLAVVAAHDRVTVEDFLVRCIRRRMDEVAVFPALDLLDAPRAPP